MNERWIENRLKEWSQTRSLSNIQLKKADDANEYLDPFFSPCAGKLFDAQYAQAVQDMLPNLSSNVVQGWNPGCGKGTESYSLACILRRRYPQAHIKIWANDNDIMSITNAPNLSFDMAGAPDYCKEFLVKGTHGYSFNQQIKDSIVFEYHDVGNGNTLPDLDIVFARDVLSFLPEEKQDQVVSEIAEKLKHQGIVFLGRNEELSGGDWKSVGKDNISAFVRA
jgi:purine-binding chemotaxis protein CheW